MRSLFWKIFGWFWLAMIAMGLTLFLVVTTTRPDPLPRPWRDSMGAALTAYASSAANVWETRGQSGLTSYLSAQEARTQGQFWFFTEHGRELSGNFLLPRGKRRPPPPDVGLFSMFRQRRPRRSPPFEHWQRLMQRALAEENAVFEMDGPRVLAMQQIIAPSGARYVLATNLPRPEFGRPVADASRQWLGVGLLLAMSTLVCYGLVRYLTGPLSALRSATQQLAAGDLSARTGAGMRGRRDEVADLGRDFDTMAERIEGLVTSQRQLLGDISHELRSPLSRLSMAQALARRHIEQGASEEEITGALDRIKRETGRLNALIEQLLQLARLESGEMSPDVELLDLATVLQDVISDADFEARISQRAVCISSSESCIVRGSPDLLGSAIENVVRNAVRYTPSGSRVEVSLRVDNETPNEIEQAVIRVRDYGQGVPEAHLTDLFRPFYRVDAARDRNSGGVGLGLAITDRAIRSHGGSVVAQNAAGGGLLVELRLPLYREERSKVL
jgi:two-component system sensor histidine kinase CpxA